MQRLGKYQILEGLGHGAMGVVYKALDTQLERLVALKVMNPHLLGSGEHQQRFEREAKAAGRLHHPNLVTIYEFGSLEGCHYIAMEFLEGESLAEILRAGPPVAFETSLQWVIQICRGLEHAHSAGVIHRDVKPANIRITSDGRVKILDFGIARLLDSHLTGTGKIFGSPSYMSPEQARSSRDVDGRSDQFSTGIILFELLTRRHPFHAENIPAILLRITMETPPRLRDLCPGLPPELTDIVARALAKRPEDRYPDCGELAYHLEQVLYRLESERAVEPVDESQLPTAWFRLDEMILPESSRDSGPQAPSSPAPPRIEPALQEGPEPSFSPYPDLRPGARDWRRHLARYLSHPLFWLAGGCVALAFGFYGIYQAWILPATVKRESPSRPGLSLPQPAPTERATSTTLEIPGIHSQDNTTTTFSLVQTTATTARENYRRVLSTLLWVTTSSPTPTVPFLEELLSSTLPHTTTTTQAMVVWPTTTTLPAPPETSTTTSEPLPSTLPVSERASHLPGEEWQDPVSGVLFVWIPEGRFMMGCSPGDFQCRPDEKPVHSVTIGEGFWLGKFEVTRSQWLKAMGKLPSNPFLPSAPREPNRSQEEELPVEGVNFRDAMQFLQRLNARGPVVYRLPTEAEWEYACRAGNPSPRYGELDQIAWFDGNSRRATHPVGRRQPNAWGLHDMLGNVWEWCLDWYGASYYASAPDRDRGGPPSGSIRVSRGGSCLTAQDGIRASYRGGGSQALDLGKWGLRLVRTARHPVRL